MSSSIRTGTSVTPSNAAKNIENVLVNASGLKSRPSCASSEKTGMKLTVITSSEKKSGRPDGFRRGDDHVAIRSRSFGSRPCFSRKCSSSLCAFSTMMMAESTIAPIAMAMPPRDMMLLVRPDSSHIGRKERRIAIGQRDDRDQRGAHVPEKNDADERHDDALFDQLVAAAWRSRS